MKDMIEKDCWSQFRNVGLLWWVNRMLHLFGWAIVYEPDTGECYPARCKFRGFSEKCETEGFRNLTAHIHESMEDMLEDSDPADEED